MISKIHFTSQSHQLRESNKPYGWGERQAEETRGRGRVNVMHGSGAAEKCSFQAQPKSSKHFLNLSLKVSKAGSRADPWLHTGEDGVCTSIRGSEGLF